MTEQAKQRIAEAIENRSTILDLSDCGLTRIPKEVCEMVWLEEFYL